MTERATTAVTAVGEAVARIRAEVGPVRIVVNNAASWAIKLFADTTPAEIDPIFAVTVTGAMQAGPGPPPRAPRPARGHRLGRVVLRLPAVQLDHRPDPFGERRLHDGLIPLPTFRLSNPGGCPTLPGGIQRRWVSWAFCTCGVQNPHERSFSAGLSVDVPALHALTTTKVSGEPGND